MQLAVEAREQRGERILGVGVDAGGRLVEDQQPRLGHDRLGDEGPLLLTPGQDRDRLVGLFRQPDPRDRGSDRVAVLGGERPEQAPPGDASGGDDLADRGGRLDTQLRPLGQVGDEPATRSDRDGPARRGGRCRPAAG